MRRNTHVNEARLIGFIHEDPENGLFQFFWRNIIFSIFLGLFWVAWEYGFLLIKFARVVAGHADVQGEAVILNEVGCFWVEDLQIGAAKNGSNELADF